MTNITKHDLDNRAIEWIRESLSVKTYLSNTLLKNVPFDHGQVWSYAPENVSASDLYQFSSGGLIKKGKSDTKYIYKGDRVYSVEAKNNCADLVSLYVKSLFDSEEIKTCVFEDIMARPSDPDIVGRLSESALVYGQEVYHMVRDHSLSLENVQDIVTAVNESWHFLCAGFSRDMDLKKLGLKEVRNFIDDLVVLIVGAYDGESFVVWEKKRHVTVP